MKIVRPNKKNIFDFRNPTEPKKFLSPKCQHYITSFAIFLKIKVSFKN